VERQSIVGTDNQKEDHVHEKLEEVGHELKIKNIRALVVPATFSSHVENIDVIFDEKGHHHRKQDDILEGKEEQHRSTFLQGLRHRKVDEAGIDSHQ